jgi:hypothetical protein
MTDEQLITACIQKIGLAEDAIRSRFGDLEQAADLLRGAALDADGFLRSLPEPAKLDNPAGRSTLRAPAFPRLREDQDS